MTNRKVGHPDMARIKGIMKRFSRINLLGILGRENFKRNKGKALAMKTDAPCRE